MEEVNTVQSNCLVKGTKDQFSFWTRLLSVLRSRPEITNPHKLQKTLFYLIFFRILIVLCLLASTLWAVLATGQNGTKVGLIYVSMAVTVVISLLNAIGLRKGTHLHLLGYSQLSFDVLLATTVIFVTGGGVSPFIFLYFLIILEGAVIFGRHGSVMIAALSGIAYGTLISGTLPRIDNNETSASTPHILGAYIALIVIALLTSYLSKQLEVAGRTIKSFARDLNNLANQQRQLFDDISEGIITVDLNQMITNINQAACAIIGLSNSDPVDIVGTQFADVLENCGVQHPEKLLRAGETDYVPAELLLERGASTTPLRISYNVRPIMNNDGAQTGSMFIFNDVSHVRNIEELLTMHEQMTKLLAEDDRAPSIGDSGSGQIQMVGESVVMRQILALVERVATSDAAVLISGESGTGKELVAKAVHLRGPRGGKPFVAINCGAIPENLIESELFGHRRGAFTGAVRDNPGLFKQANGGTIFLDEVGDLPLHLQTKLLRVLQDKTVRAVGDVFDFPVDVRVIAASNRDLRQQIQAGRFREDLFYRLNVVNIVLPPLRMRRDDIPHLVRHFIGKFTKPDDVLPQISPEALQLLMSYPFPGNIRELENILERALVLGGSAILAEHLPPELSKATFPKSEQNGAAHHSLPLDLESELAELEKHYLFEALDHAGGIKKQAARLLGLNFRSFRYRLKKYGVSETENPE